MDSDEISKLISDLYNAKDRQQISDILEYMGEDGNGVFVYPILDGYKKHKYSSLGYYFLWNLSRLDYAETGKRLNELLENYEIHKEHIPMALFFMAERKFFSEIGNKMAGMYFEYYLDPEFRKDFNVNSLGLGCVLDYVYEGGILYKFEDKLRELIFSDIVNEGERAGALNFLLEIDQDRQMDFLIDNYEEKIKGAALENILAKKLIFCSSEDAYRLRSMIIEKGSKESSDFLLRFEASSPKKLFGTGRPKTVYNCIRVTIKVGIMREQLNKKTVANENFGFPIFAPNSMLVHQAQCVDDKAVFLELCSDLLKIVRSVSPEARERSLERKGKEDFLKGFSDNEKDLELAHFLLYLNAKGVGVDYDFFGFRNLDRTLVLLLENKEDKEFFDKLESIGIAHLYRKNQWHKLHGYLMNSYLQSLENMNKVFNQFVKQD